MSTPTTRHIIEHATLRMVSYTRKGYRVEKDDQKRVKIVQG